MPHKRGEPRIGEIVICTIGKINPNSAYCELKEYEKKEALIHISEVSSGWIRDIRHFLKEGKDVAAVVLRTNPLELSIKRVNVKKRSDKIKEWNLEKRAEKMLANIAKEKGISLEKAYEEIGYNLQETFGTLYAAFKEAVQRPDRLKRYAGDWFEDICKTAKKEIGEKQYEFKAELILQSLDPDGIAKIKDVLRKVQKEGFSVKYIAAPRYMVLMKSKDPKKARKEMEEKLARLSSNANGLKFKFNILNQ